MLRQHRARFPFESLLQRPDTEACCRESLPRCADRESDQLHCLSLVDGKFLWKLPREDNVYVACVHKGNAILVGRKTLQAVKLADAKEGKPDLAWNGQTLSIPGGASPSGRGFYSGNSYYLPLTSAAVVRIDLDAGAVKETFKSRKGYIPGNGKNGACNPTETSPNTNKLGRDSAYPDAGGRLGNGIWDFDTYWAANFGGAAPNGWSNANRPSRYDVYRYEIANNYVATSAVGGLAKGKETGAPACYSGGPLSDNPDRRVLYGAVIDCTNLNVHGNSGGPLPVTTFAKFFLTEPVAADGTIYAELSGLVQPGSVSTDVARDIVQIYR